MYEFVSRPPDATLKRWQALINDLYFYFFSSKGMDGWGGAPPLKKNILIGVPRPHDNQLKRWKAPLRIFVRTYRIF